MCATDMNRGYSGGAGVRGIYVNSNASVVDEGLDIIEELHDDLLPKKEVALKKRLW